MQTAQLQSHTKADGFTHRKSCIRALLCALHTRTKECL